MDWWQKNQENFPYLSVLARIYLSVNPTSVASERIFSKAGYIINNKRSNLKEKKLNQFIFISENQKFINNQ